MALDLPFFRTGAKFREELTAERLNKMVAAIRSLEIQSGTNVRVSRQPGGTTLKTAHPKAIRSSGSGGACPFDVSVRLEGSTYKVRVRPGTLNGLYATNYAESLSFDSTTLTVGATATSNVVLSVTTDGKQVTSHTIEMQSSLTAMSPTTPLAPTTFKWPVAHVKNGVVYKTIACGSLQAVVKENVRIAKSPTTPDDNAYDIYYYWVLESV
jgi:hypothetical protein